MGRNCLCTTKIRLAFGAGCVKHRRSSSPDTTRPTSPQSGRPPRLFRVADAFPAYHYDRDPDLSRARASVCCEESKTCRDDMGFNRGRNPLSCSTRGKALPGRDPRTRRFLLLYALSHQTTPFPERSFRFHQRVLPSNLERSRHV